VQCRITIEVCITVIVICNEGENYLRKNLFRLSAAMLGVVMSILPVTDSHAEAPAGQYIVVLRDNSAETPETAAAVAESLGSTVTFVYRHALRGYAATLTHSALAHVRHDPDVAYVEPDGEAHGTLDHNNPPSWGLDRIDQRYRPLNRRYSYHATGFLHRIYVIDSGIRYTHGDFAGRAIPGYDAVTSGGLAQDCHGHGTHVASTIGGGFYGIARATTLVGVRVLGCGNTGTWSQVIAGVDWVTGDHTGNAGAIANMSISGGVNQAADDAVRRSIADGITYTIAAGNNSGDNACNYSPARVAEAITVGATDINDNRAWFSNDLGCIDLWAPGQDIWAASHVDDLSAALKSGTSMAAPHVVGVAAQYLETNPMARPGDIDYWIKNKSTKNVVTGVSINPHLLYTDFGILP
jgi:subtilisin family serine protease